MLRPRKALTLPGIHRRRVLNLFSHIHTRPGQNLRPPLDIDPALQKLLEDTDLSLRHTRGEGDDPYHGRKRRELEVIGLNDRADVPSTLASIDDDAEDASLFPSVERKSPAASFGSRRIGSVTLPFELERSIAHLISEAEKGMVHADATRLFQEENGAEDAWSMHYSPPSYTTPSSGTRMSHIKARLARNRDGTAFASVVMPAQYAVVTAVLTSVLTRLGPEWSRRISRVIEWGSGTGAGLWASLYTFGNGHADSYKTLNASHISAYIGIETRDGLTSIARRLLRDVPLGNISVSFQKSLHDSDRVPRNQGLGTIALSTFVLSTLGDPRLRRQMIREMWNSGADVIVVIDDASTESFQYIAEARKSLLDIGQRELSLDEAFSTDTIDDDRGKRGAHVIAPCPHDSACPLHVSGGHGVRCAFEQRMQRPKFVRRTKHASGGEEDVGYSYVVVRRGERPQSGHVVPGMETGRVGAVGQWEEDAAKRRELAERRRTSQEEGQTDFDYTKSAEVQRDVGDGTDDLRAGLDDMISDGVESHISGAATESEDTIAKPLGADSALEDKLRLEAYNWPRINFPPLKRSGHIIVDACMPNGQEMRLTFPRSQGKQIFYDARKSAWGDLFPHAPKHKPVSRYAISGIESDPKKSKSKDLGGEGALAGVGLKAATRAQWSGVMEGLKEVNRRKRKERRRVRSTKEMSDDN